MITHIETERLILRKIQHSDAEGIFNTYAQDTELTRYLTWTPHKDIEETHDFVSRVKRNWDLGTEYAFMIVPKETGKLIGCIGSTIKGGKAHGGYVLAQPFWGQGYTTEAFQGLIPQLFSIRGIHRVEAICATENIGSARVMQKAGLTHEGILKHYLMFPYFGEAKDVHMYGLTKQAWQSKTE